jgi:pyrimidine operon attenuation protein/uracil phosphoribosyltransferase
MGQIELIIALVGFIVTNAVFVVTIIGAVLYLRADSRANRQEWKAELSEFRASVTSAINKLSDDVAQLGRRLTVLEAKVDALDAKLVTKAEELSVQAERNHRELLIRLAFHHHGDGRYPVAPATDPEPVDPAGGE